jgi:flagellar basal body rod protein FlgG
MVLQSRLSLEGEMQATDVSHDILLNGNAYMKMSVPGTGNRCARHYCLK